MKLTFYGHASLGIEVGETNILVDPFISQNPNASAIDIETLKADYILVTHAHQDHILDVETIAKRTDAVVVSNFEIATYYDNKGIKNHPMNHGGKWNFDFGIVKYVTAIHTSSFPDGSYGGQPGGFIIQAGEKTIYIAGDTALTLDMKLIPKFFDLNLAVLPIGDNFTMGLDEALVASDYVNCDKVLGVHYNTFDYIKIDGKKAMAKFLSKEKDLILLEIGDSIEI